MAYRLGPRVDRDRTRVVSQELDSIISGAGGGPSEPNQKKKPIPLQDKALALQHIKKIAVAAHHPIQKPYLVSTQNRKFIDPGASLMRPKQESKASKKKQFGEKNDYFSNLPVALCKRSAVLNAFLICIQLALSLRMS